MEIDGIEKRIPFRGDHGLCFRTGQSGVDGLAGQDAAVGTGRRDQHQDLFVVAALGFVDRKCIGRGMLRQGFQRDPAPFAFGRRIGEKDQMSFRVQSIRLRTLEGTSVVAGEPEDPRVAVEYVCAVVVLEGKKSFAGNGSARIREVEDRTQKPVERSRAVGADIERRQDAELFEALPGIVDGVFVVIVTGGCLFRDPSTSDAVRKELP